MASRVFVSLALALLVLCLVLLGVSARSVRVSLASVPFSASSGAVAYTAPFELGSPRQHLPLALSSDTSRAFVLGSACSLPSPPAPASSPCSPKAFDPLLSNTSQVNASVLLHLKFDLFGDVGARVVTDSANLSAALSANSASLFLADSIQSDNPLLLTGQVAGVLGIGTWTNAVSSEPAPLIAQIIVANALAARASLCLGPEGGLLSLGDLDPALFAPQSSRVSLVSNRAVPGLSALVYSVQTLPVSGIPSGPTWSDGPYVARLDLGTPTLRLPPATFTSIVSSLPCDVADACTAQNTFDPTRRCYYLEAKDVLRFPSLTITVPRGDNLTLNATLKVGPEHYFATLPGQSCVAFALESHDVLHELVLGLPFFRAHTLVSEPSALSVAPSAPILCGDWASATGAPLPTDNAGSAYLLLVLAALAAVAGAAWLTVFLRRRCRSRKDKAALVAVAVSAPLLDEDSGAQHIDRD